MKKASPAVATKRVPSKVARPAPAALKSAIKQPAGSASPSKEVQIVTRNRSHSCPAQVTRDRLSSIPTTPISPSRKYGWFQRPTQDDLLAYCAWAAIASSRDCLKQTIDADSFKQSFHYEVDEAVGVKVVAPSVFMWIRKATCNTTEAVWRAGWEFPFTTATSEGKSGANFAKSHDQSFFLKTITESEHRVVRDILPELYEHFRKHPRSLINKPIGLFTVEAKGKLHHYMAVANVLSKSAPLYRLFDLKGSTANRVAHPDQYKKDVPLLKDVDWTLAGNRVKVPSTQYPELSKALSADVKFLLNLGVMDYSLFVGWCKADGQKPAPGARMLSHGGETFYLGIIDFLQMYNMSRRIAHAARGMVSDPTTISTVPPKEYADRFEKFVVGQVFEKVVERPGARVVRRVPPAAAAAPKQPTPQPAQPAKPVPAKKPLGNAKLNTSSGKLAPAKAAAGRRVPPSVQHRR
eukprot:TRINITY_DN768_c2_g1_i1.p1 TRINITY_DN768_c2_g1~~TRINITY_DN768_c2_g1_i1.p1  ORF type:complete len:464 (+),score=148.43 TRINITY_DN768_c2_g1_i1:139-1530(+)